MPLGPPGPPRHNPGQRSVSAKGLNAGRTLMDRLANLRSAGGVMWSPAGPLMRGSGTLIRIGRTPAGGIPGMDSSGVNGGDCTDVTLTISPDNPNLATLNDWTTKFTGFQLSSQPTGDSVIIVAALMLGLWLIIWEDCPKP